MVCWRRFTLSSHRFTLSSHLTLLPQTGLLETVSSQSFRQQMASFSSALQTGQLSLAQFGLNAKVRSQGGRRWGKGKGSQGGLLLQGG